MSTITFAKGGYAHPKDGEVLSYCGVAESVYHKLTPGIIVHNLVRIRRYTHCVLFGNQLNVSSVTVGDIIVLTCCFRLECLIPLSLA